MYFEKIHCESTQTAFSPVNSDAFPLETQSNYVVKTIFCDLQRNSKKNPTDFTGGKALFSFYNEFQKTDAEKDGPLSP